MWDIIIALDEIFLNFPTIIISALCFAILILLILCVISMRRISALKKRCDIFMGSSKKPEHNLETKLTQYYKDVQKINANYDKVLSMTQDIDENMRHAIQKVGVVRYNPFEEMGGNLCFAIALLDDKDNGVVINGLHGRNGSYTYAKPIEMGVSKYVLSDEEKEAIEKAKNSAYTPSPERKLRVVMPPKKYKAKFNKKSDDLKASEQKAKNNDQTTQPPDANVKTDAALETENITKEQARENNALKENATEKSEPEKIEAAPKENETLKENDVVEEFYSDKENEMSDKPISKTEKTIKKIIEPKQSSDEHTLAKDPETFEEKAYNFKDNSEFDDDKINHAEKYVQISRRYSGKKKSVLGFLRRKKKENDDELEKYLQDNESSFFDDNFDDKAK